MPSEGLYLSSPALTKGPFLSTPFPIPPDSTLLSLLLPPTSDCNWSSEPAITPCSKVISTSEEITISSIAFELLGDKGTTALPFDHFVCSHWTAFAKASSSCERAASSSSSVDSLFRLHS